MGLFNFLKKNANTLTVQKLCEILRPSIGETYSDSTATEKYRSWIYVCANHNAVNVADAELKLFSKRKPRVSSSRKIGKSMEQKLQSYSMQNKNVYEIESHPIIDLLHRPNSDDSFYSFIYKIQLFLELCGDSYTLIERNQRGIPIALHVLFSQYITIQTDGGNEVVCYHYGLRHGNEWQYSYPPEDIIHFKNFDPNRVHYGISPLEACAQSYGLVESMNLYEQALNRNMGVPTGILKYLTKQLKESDNAIIEAKWSQKFASVGRAGKTVVLGSDMEYQQIGVSPRDMQWLDGRKWTRSEILACYGVPPALIDTESVNRSNMVTSSINYYHNTLKPRCKLISQTLTNQLINQNGIDGRNLFVIINKDAPQDTEQKLESMTLLANNGALTKNELRAEFGYEEVKDNEANVLPQITQATQINRGE